jgi:hypothetical protein
VRHVDPQRHRVLFTVGVALVALNVPLGWLGLLVCGALAATRREPRWAWAGVAAYAFSWVLLGVGLLITGKAGVARAREIFRRRRRHRAILHLRRGRRAAQAELRPPGDDRPE